MRPIFNLLALLYNFIGDFGVAIIILAVIVRLALWPLVKKQLHQTKLMRSIQPDLKKIKQKTKGNRMLESQMMMELYREKGIKMGATIWPMLIQLPILIAVFSVIRLFDMNLPTVPQSLEKSGDINCSKVITEYADSKEKDYCNAVKTRDEREAKLRDFPYPGIADLTRVKNMTNDPENFKPKMFGFVDLTKSGFNYAPAIILAALAAAFQYIQMKQTMPNQGQKRRLRDMMREAAAGKEADQSEMVASSMNTMMKFLPIMTFFFAVNFPSALALYWATTSGATILQQKFLLSKDLGEMEKIANKPDKKPKKSTKKIREAEIVKIKPSKSQKSIVKSPPSSGGTTVVRRIKAK